MNVFLTRNHYNNGIKNSPQKIVKSISTELQVKVRVHSKPRVILAALQLQQSMQILKS